MKKNIILFLLLTFGGFSLGFGTGRHLYKRPPAKFVDTIYNSDIVYIPEPLLIETYVPEIQPIIDTNAIINDYLKAKVYNDTLVSNNNITAILRDTIYQNTLLGRTFNYTLSMPVMKSQERPFSLFLTADTRFSTSLVVMRKKWLIQGGYDFRNKYPFLGVGFKLY